MGPPAAADVLRDALFRGADEALLLTDRAFAGADTLATSYALSCAAKKVGKVDLILCGRQAIDGDTAQVGPQLAEKLKMPQICYVEEVLELAENKIVARRAIEGGYEILESPLPCLLTVIDANDPRPPAAKRIMKYKRAMTKSEINKKVSDPYTGNADADAEIKALEAKGLIIAELTAEAVNADPARVGMAGSPTKVKAIQSVVLAGGEAKKIEPTTEGINALIHELIADHTLG